MSIGTGVPPGHGGSRRFRRQGILVVAVLIVLGVAVVPGLVNGWVDRGPAAAESTSEALARTSQGTETDATSPALDLPVPTPAPIGTEEEAVQAVGNTVASLLDATNQVLQRADGSVTGAELFAEGFVLGELQALATERQQSGLRQVGEAEITEVTVVSTDLDAQPPGVVVRVCIDTSQIDVVDESGTSLKDQLYAPGHPVEHKYGAFFSDGLWKIATHEIPDEGTCS